MSCTHCNGSGYSLASRWKSRLRWTPSWGLCKRRKWTIEWVIIASESEQSLDDIMLRLTIRKSSDIEKKKMTFISRIWKTELKKYLLQFLKPFPTSSLIPPHSLHWTLSVSANLKKRRKAKTDHSPHVFFSRITKLHHRPPEKEKVYKERRLKPKMRLMEHKGTLWATLFLWFAAEMRL